MGLGAEGTAGSAGASMHGGWVNPHREQQTIPQGQTSSPSKSLHGNGQSAPRSGGARDVGRGAGSHTPSTASEFFSQGPKPKIAVVKPGQAVSGTPPMPQIARVKAASRRSGAVEGTTVAAAALSLQRGKRSEAPHKPNLVVVRPGEAASIASGAAEDGASVAGPNPSWHHGRKPRRKGHGGRDS